MLLLVLAALDLTLLGLLAGAGKGVLAVLSVVTGVVVYLLPTIVAAVRQHDAMNAIFVLNLALGWTFIGWVVALVWAVK